MTPDTHTFLLRELARNYASAVDWLLLVQMCDLGPDSTAVQTARLRLTALKQTCDSLLTGIAEPAPLVKLSPGGAFVTEWPDKLNGVSTGTEAAA